MDNEAAVGGVAGIRIEALERELASAKEYLALFIKRLGVTQVSGGANHAEVALCKLEELQAEHEGMCSECRERFGQ